MRWLNIPLLILTCVLPLQAAMAVESSEQLARQVREAEASFAKTMADRDLNAFAAFVAEDAIFFGASSALRGKGEVVAGWKKFYDARQAPFSWQPQTIEVLASGTLAHSSGPVFDAQGRQIASFNSIWRRAADGAWKVVFDKGCDACSCK